MEPETQTGKDKPMKAWLKIDSPAGENLDYCPIEIGGAWQAHKDWELCDGCYGLIEYLHVRGQPATDNHPADGVLEQLFVTFNAVGAKAMDLGVKVTYDGFTAEIVSSLPDTY